MRKACSEGEGKVNGIARVSLMTSLQPMQASIYSIHSTIYHNFADVLYGCDTWSVILREEHTLMVVQNGSWGEYLGLRGSEWNETAKNCIMVGVVMFVLHRIL